MPKSIDEYLYRIALSTRGGKWIKATSLYQDDIDADLGTDIVRIMEQTGQPVPDFLMTPN